MYLQSGSPSCERDRQTLDATKGNTRYMLWLLNHQLWLVEAPEQGVEGDLGFEPGQGGTQAEMDTMAEGHMPVISAFEVQLVGVVELCRITVGRTKAE